MRISPVAGLPLFVAAGQCVLAIGYALFGEWQRILLPLAVAAGLIALAVVIQLIKNHHERKSNGRHRKASEAHRAGAGGSAGNGPRARYRAYRDAVRAGAGMSGGILGPYGAGGSRSQKVLDEMVRNMINAQTHQALAGGLVNVLPAGKAYPVPATTGPRPAGEFDGKTKEFAAGVVTGTRSFDVDKLGRLRGVAYAAVWTPGENVAKCMQRREAYMYIDDEPRVRESSAPSHSLVDCAHGFYGYYEGSNDYYEHGRVMGVVEAYGETIIGSRGFRASKARIVALHIPPEVSFGKRRLITRNYPDVAIFDSFEAMVGEFPPDDGGEGLNPTTDPDFWTRKA